MGQDDDGYDVEVEVVAPHVEEAPAAVAVQPEADLNELSGTHERLQDLGQLAHGGMAAVRRAFDRHIRRHVAVKKLGLADPHVSDAADFLVEEAQITGQLEHPNIVPVYDLGAAPEGGPMFVMRLVHGRTLTSLMRQYWRGGRNPIELREILEVLLKVCDAVSYAHSRGVVHRDLKPDNIMIGTHGQVYVMDWGCALLLAGADAQLPHGMRSRRNAPNILLGTASYMAPEQARGEVDRIEGRTDVYGIGAILYQILIEKPPHRAPSFLDSVRAAQLGDVMHPAEARPDLDLPSTLVDITMRALAPEVDGRFASVDEMRGEIERVVLGIDWFPRRRFAPGETIVRQGEAAYTAYVVESGHCEVTRTVMGQPTTVRQIGRGDVFGETAIFTDLVRSATVTALGDVVAIEITRSAFEHRIGSDSWLGNFMRTLARRFRDAERKLDAAGAATAFARVVEATRVHLHAAGVRRGPNRLESPWSPLRDSLAEVLDMDPMLVTEAVRGSSVLTLDEGRDVVSGPT